jgi:hypothetical protein
LKMYLIKMVLYRDFHIQKSVYNIVEAAYQWNLKNYIKLETNISFASIDMKEL